MIYGATNNPLKPIKGEIQTLARLGFDYLELCLDPPESDPDRIMLQKNEILSILDDQGLKMIVGHLPTGVWLADLYESIREASVAEVLKGMDICAEFGLKKTVLHPGYISGLLKLIAQTGRDHAAMTLTRILDEAEKRGLTICLENMFPQLGNMYRPEDFEGVLADFPRVMMTLDLGHANIRSPRDQGRRFVEVAGNRIRHVHVGDNSGQEDEHLPVGVGRADLTSGLGALKKIGYDETITLEVFTPDCDYLELSLRKVKTLWDGA